MEKKVAQVIADFLVEKGVTDLFTVTGGGAMHLNDALGHKEGLHSIYNHHEQACAIAAEGYARETGRVAAVCVTSGPGGTNAITGVLGGWQDSIPMFVVSGQVKRETTLRATDVPLRQLGDQEFNIVDCVGVMTKYCHMVMEPESILYHLEKAWFLCNNGRKGPVWLDIPLDVQAAKVDPETLGHFDPEAEGLDAAENPIYDESLTDVILAKIKAAKRPVVFAGTAIRLADAHKEFLDCIKALQVPVVTAWNAHDVLPDAHPLYCGRPGTVGTRGGNFIVQNCDLLLVIGSRLNIRLISYNYRDFAKEAYKIIVDIDEKELKKPTVTPDLPVHANLKDVCKALSARVAKAAEHGLGCESGSGVEEAMEEIRGEHKKWLKWCRQINEKYPACLPSYYEKDTPINPYVFIHKLFDRHLVSGDKVACGNGGACVITFQGCVVKEDQRIFTNSGCAAMGYGFPASIGVSVAHPDQRVICIDGDGSFQMNIQELQTVVYNNMNLKIIILNNNGYHSIRQTQTNLFKGEPLVGVCDGNGLSFPDLSKLAPAYGLPYYRVDSISGMDAVTEAFLNCEGPALLEACVDPEQNFEPKLSSKVLPDGRIVSPPQDDMFPFLPKEEYEANKDMSQFM